MGERLGIELQPRDYELLRGLFESRIMTLAHISALYFDGKSEMAKKRVQKLKAAGIVRERPRRVSEPSVLFLTRKAFQLLHDRGRLADYPRISISDLEKRAQVSELTLKHELEVMDVKAAIMTAVNRTDRYRVAEFSTWPRLYEFKACKPSGDRVTVRPDGFLRILEREPDGGRFEHTFFLEVDRSTKTLDVLCQTCQCYRDYYRSGGFAERHGLPREKFAELPFIVLMVFHSEKRKNNLADSLLRLTNPILQQVWLTTINEISDDPLEAIWTRPKDYKQSTPEATIHWTLRKPDGRPESAVKGAQKNLSKRSLFHDC